MTKSTLRPVVIDGWSFERMLTASEVGAMFGVNSKTVSKWRSSGRLVHIRTLGGHSRYSAAQVEHLLAEGAQEVQVSAP